MRWRTSCGRRTRFHGRRQERGYLAALRGSMQSGTQEGELVCNDFGDWMRLTLLEWLAREDAA